jgi:hypothetical protein
MPKILWSIAVVYMVSCFGSIGFAILNAVAPTATWYDRVLRTVPDRRRCLYIGQCGNMTSKASALDERTNLDLMQRGLRGEPRWRWSIAYHVFQPRPETMAAGRTAQEVEQS